MVGCAPVVVVVVPVVHRVAQHRPCCHQGGIIQPYHPADIHGSHQWVRICPRHATLAPYYHNPWHRGAKGFEGCVQCRLEPYGGACGTVDGVNIVPLWLRAVGMVAPEAAVGVQAPGWLAARECWVGGQVDGHLVCDTVLYPCFVAGWARPSEKEIVHETHAPCVCG